MSKEDPLDYASEHFEYMVLRQFDSLSLEEREKIEAGLRLMVADIKSRPRNKDKKLSTTNVLIAIMAALYFTKYGESPSETRLTVLRKEQKAHVRAMAEV